MIDAPPPPQVSRPSSRTRHVLIVDDDPVISSFIAETLAEEGYITTSASNGAVALRLLAEARRAGQRPPDLILLDMRMPVMDGWAFAQAYRELPGPCAPIMVITAAHDSRERAGEVGAVSVLPKPFDLEQLVEEVERCITGEMRA